MRYWTIKILLIVGILPFGLSAQPIEEGENLTIEVTVVGIDKLKGDIRIALYNEEGNFPSESDIDDFRVESIKEATHKVKFNVASKGKYAIAVLHDVSKNGGMDFNIVGYPKEPYGFSNNPGIWYRKPTFTECAFDVSQNTSIKVELN
ncbi:DUF2141 domain-containing protein [Portibacter lacus]|uniref:DUF2141 domain-containing protein n=1 Tax=Portibacter lacus TaxID=1099794 RepID=A0AA37SQF0_9BACT|nr:DUF2141 domain-containing protein [Portibacter lacus]GLR17857.1 hypothetical protein GCM10007940_24720 [Portibacter lacus]